MIQILVWIWSFFRKLGPSESHGLLSDVMLFMCVFVGNKATEERVYGSWSLGIQSTSQPVPTTVEAVSQSGSINLSTYPSKNPLGPLGAKAGYWYERRVPGVTQQALNTHSCTLIWKAAKYAHIIHNDYILIVTSVWQIYIFSPIYHIY